MHIPTMIHASLLMIAIVCLASCARGAEDPELTPEQQARMAAGVQAMVDGATWKGPQTFTLRVTDPAGKPLSDVPVLGDVIKPSGNAMTSLLSGKGFLSTNWIPVTTNREGVAVISAENYDSAMIRLDYERIGSRFICTYAMTAPDIWPLSVAAQDRQWLKEGHPERLRRTATVQVVPTKGPEPLLKLSWYAGVREADAFRPVTLMLGEYGESMGTDIARYPAFDPQLPPRDLVLSGGREAPSQRESWDASKREKVPASPSPWWFEITCQRGVAVQDASADPHPYWAPETGWRRVLRLESVDGTRTRFPVKLWFRRTGSPVRYAIFVGEMRLDLPSQREYGTYKDDLGLRGTLWVNLSGSRNLERPGPDQWMYWKPEPVTPKARNPIIHAWAAEPADGAVPYVDDPPAPKK